MDEKSASLDCLPFEIIEQILYYETISFIDVCRLSTVSQIFNCIAKSNKLWQNKYTLMWPDLAALFDANNTDWKSEFRFKHECKITVDKALQDMSVEFYHTDKISNDSFLKFRDLCADHPFTDQILIDELESVIYDSNRYLNLTHKYYAKRALRYMRHRLLETIWQSFITDNPQSLTLLKGACLVSRWCQPTKKDCTSKVIALLNDMLKVVFERISTVDSRHPVLKTGLPVLGKDDGQILEKSLWTPYECKKILTAINHVMFNSYHFRGNVSFFYSPGNSLIDKVLETSQGIPITMSIIYQTIAAQFGVALLPVNFPGHFLLKWLEYPDLSGVEAYTFIDVYDNGYFKNSQHLQELAPGYDRISNDWVDAVSPLKVFIRMCWNLVEVGRQHDGEGEGLLCLCDALELLSILSPDDMEHKLLLARVYMHLCINMTQVVSLLQEISERDPVTTGTVGFLYRTAITSLETERVWGKSAKKVKCFRREAAPGVRFAVGMIMKHKRYDYRCVIYSWDVVCSASGDWIKQMGVHNLMYKDQQPFYHVLVEDGTNRYAAQENLEIDRQSDIIRHIEVGRFFQSFHGHYYLPNDQKLKEYPDDIQARETALSCAAAEEN